MIISDFWNVCGRRIDCATTSLTIGESRTDKRGWGTERLGKRERHEQQSPGGTARKCEPAGDARPRVAARALTQKVKKPTIVTHLS